MNTTPLAAFGWIHALILALVLGVPGSASAELPEYQVIPLFDISNFSAPGLPAQLTTTITVRDFVSSTEIGMEVGFDGATRSAGFYDLTDGSFSLLPRIGSDGGTLQLNGPFAYAANRHAVGTIADTDPNSPNEIDTVRFAGSSAETILTEGAGGSGESLRIEIAFRSPHAAPINGSGVIVGTISSPGSGGFTRPVAYPPSGSRIFFTQGFRAGAVNEDNDVLLVSVTTGDTFVVRDLGQGPTDAIVHPPIPGFSPAGTLGLLNSGEALIQYRDDSNSSMRKFAVLDSVGLRIESDPFPGNQFPVMNDLDQAFVLFAGFRGLGALDDWHFWDAENQFVPLLDLLDPNDPDTASISGSGIVTANASGDLLVQIGSMFYLLTPAPIFSWLPNVDGFFDDDLNWVSNSSLSTGVPGTSTTIPNRIDISQPGSYTVSGVPDEALKSVSVGNDLDIIALDLELDTFETEQLSVFGTVLLADGVFEAGYDSFASTERLSAGVFQGGQLLLNANATLRVGFALDSIGPTGPGFAFGELGLVGLGTGLSVSGKVEADSIATGLIPSGGPTELDTVFVSGAGSMIEAVAYRAGVASFSRSELMLEAAGELRVRDRVELGIAADSRVDATVTGNGSGIFGLNSDLFDTGPKDIIVGDAGTATLTLDNAVLQVGEKLVLGQSAGGQGSLVLTNGANLFTSSTKVSDIIVGDAGSGTLQIDAGSSFASTLAIVDQLTFLTLGGSAGGVGTMDLDGGFSSTETAFAGLVIGAAGVGNLTAVDGAQILTETFLMGISAAPQSSQLHLDVGATLNVRDGLGAQIGSGGDGLVLVDAISTFSVRRVNPLAPDEAQVASVGSDAIGGAGLLIIQNVGSGDFDTLSIGELSAPPTNSTLTTLTRGRTGAVQVDAFSTLDATQIRVGGDGLLSADQATVTVGLDLVIGSGVGSLGALVEVVDSMLGVNGGSIQIGTIPADTLTSEFRVLQNSSVGTQGIDARGGAVLTIDDSLVIVGGNAFLGAFRPVQDPNGMVLTTVSGPTGILGAPFGTIQVGGDGSDCTCISVLEISNGGLVETPTLTVERGGILLGNNGRVQGTVVVKPGGTISPGLSPGRLTVDGNVTFEAGSNLHIQIGGLTGSQFDFLEVVGDVNFDGDLTLEFVDGFAPQMADEIDFLSSSGTLDLAAQQVAIMNLAPGFLFDLASIAGGVRMTALNDAVFVPAPGADASMLAAVVVLALLLRARRASMRSAFGLA